MNRIAQELLTSQHNQLQVEFTRLKALYELSKAKVNHCANHVYYVGNCLDELVQLDQAGVGVGAVEYGPQLLDLREELYKTAGNLYAVIEDEEEQVQAQLEEP